MEDNPYSTLAAAFAPGERGAGELVLGKVLSLSPLRILAEGNTLEREDLLCAASLLDGAVRAVEAQLTGALSVSASCPAGQHSAATVTGGTLSGTIRTTHRAFAAGDTLLLLAIEDRQRYIILCRVVTL